jgi:hypothetical protein
MIGIAMYTASLIGQYNNYMCNVILYITIY